MENAKDAKCTYRGCDKKATLVTDRLARCAYHLMLEADKDRRGALYWQTGWSDPERRDRVQAKAEMLRQQMLNPEWFRGDTEDERKKIREEAMSILRDYVNKF